MSEQNKDDNEPKLPPLADENCLHCHMSRALYLWFLMACPSHVLPEKGSDPMSTLGPLAEVLTDWLSQLPDPMIRHRAAEDLADQLTDHLSAIVQGRYKLSPEDFVLMHTKPEGSG